MKLVKLYANKNFKNIEFNLTGCNVIIGQVKDKADQKKDTHNLGKTALIQVIDFMLLKKIDKYHFFKKYQSKFKEHIFFIEVLLNSNKYLVLRRSVKQPTKISFKLNNIKLKTFQQNINWDEENVSFVKAKEKLSQYLFFNVAPNWGYRTSVTYFLRSQYDYRDVFQLAKFSVGPHSEWKPFLFDLLGFNGKLLDDKYLLGNEIENLVNVAGQLKSQYKINTKEMDKLKGLLEIKNTEKEDAESKIDNFNFYSQDKKINEELLDKLDSQICALNSMRYKLSYEGEKIEKSLDKSVPQFDMDAIKKMYAEVKVYFSKVFLRDYEDLENFVMKVSSERKKYLEERFRSVEQELKETEEQLSSLDKQKSKMLSVLKDKKSYEKFKYYQKQLSKNESEIVRIEERLKSVDKIGDLETLVENKEKEIESCVKSIKDAISISNDDYKELRKHFNYCIKSILNVPAIISIILNAEGNVEFNADIQDPEGMEVTAEGYGTTYKKLLCVAFDIALLMTYADKSFYKYVYHDGSLEGLDDRKKISYLDLMRDVCKTHDLQYIFTVIDSDVPKDKIGKRIKFDNNEIVLKLDDSGSKGRLFEINF